MSSNLNLTLTDELRAFIDRNCGDGTLYATPTEFMRDILREKKERLEAAELRAVFSKDIRMPLQAEPPRFREI